MINTHKYTNRIDANSKEIILVKDGKDVNCHKVPPVMGQDNFGRTVKYNMPCGTHCGRANICNPTAGSPLFYFQQTCESHIAEFMLEQNKEQDPKTPSPIITLA